MMRDVNALITERIPVSYGQLAAFCRANHIRRLALFGSVLREDFQPESDIDVLVEFEPDTIIGLKYITIQDSLSELLGRKVDLNTAGFLSPHFRQKVLASAEVLYERSG